jgi:hypothetical protein
MKRSAFIKRGLLGFVGLLFVVVPKNNYNRVEYYDNGWEKVEFENIKKDMYIRMFEPDDEPVIMVWKNEKPIYGAFADCDAYIREGIPVVMIKTL